MATRFFSFCFMLGLLATAGYWAHTQYGADPGILIAAGATILAVSIVRWIVIALRWPIIFGLPAAAYGIQITTLSYDGLTMFAFMVSAGVYFVTRAPRTRPEPSLPRDQPKSEPAPARPPSHVDPYEWFFRD